MTDFTHITQPLLTWFDANKRALPFRENRTPYRIWVSEIMLQQTRMSAVLPYYQRFMQALPTVEALAACPPDQLNKLWEGLGYYSRVRNLQKAAQVVVKEYGGGLPADYNALRGLPGIGEYTAGAIASMGFNLPHVAVDGNVLRVTARVCNDSGNILTPEVKRRMSALVQSAQPQDRPGDYNEALMELGALVCLPGGAPLCGQCPLAQLCAARAAGTQLTLPVKTPLRSRKQLEYTVALVVRGGKGVPPAPLRSVLLEQRPQDGLLAGLWQPLLLPGRLSAQAVCAALAQRGLSVSATEQDALPPAKHVFTHLEWHMTGYLCHAAPADGSGNNPAEENAPAPPHCVWATGEEVRSLYALPGAFKVYKKLIVTLL